MVNVVEIVLELEASGFLNSAKSTRGRVVRAISTGALTCQVDDVVKGVDLPKGEFQHLDEARLAIIKYWDACSAALSTGYWQPSV